MCMYMGRVLMVMVSHIETLIIVLEVTFLLVVRRFGYIMWPEHKKRRERERLSLITTSRLEARLVTTEPAGLTISHYSSNLILSALHSLSLHQPSTRETDSFKTGGTLNVFSMKCIVHIFITHQSHLLSLAFNNTIYFSAESLTQKQNCPDVVLFIQTLLHFQVILISVSI